MPRLAQRTRELGHRVVGRSGFTPRYKLYFAFRRALRTFFYGIAAAFPAAAIGVSLVTATYWEALGFSVVAAALTGVVSFLYDVAAFPRQDRSMYLEERAAAMVGAHDLAENPDRPPSPTEPPLPF